MGQAYRGFRAGLPGLVAVLALLGLAALAGAQTTVVTLKDGRKFEGQLVRQNDRQVVLKIAGVPTPISRAKIDTIKSKASAQERYKKARAKIADDDYDARYHLADKMFQEGELRIANRALASLLKDKPDFRRAKLLKLVVEQQLKLRAESKRNKAKHAHRGADHAQPRRGAGRGGRANRSPFKSNKDLLSPDQINLIRVWELPQDLSKMANRILVPRKAIDELFKNHRDEASLPKGTRAQTTFRREPDWQQVQAIFSIKARELYKYIKVRQDPPTMRTYRRLVGPGYVDHYFYQHFGKGQVKGLRLVPPGVFNSTATAYTNFYLLSKFQTSQGNMIDRQRPGRSLLLQWGLPRDSATYPAPDVPGWRPFFQTPDNRTFQRFASWIGNLYGSPDYGINYQPPQPGGEGNSGRGNPGAQNTNSPAPNNNSAPNQGG